MRNWIMDTMALSQTYNGPTVIMFRQRLIPYSLPFINYDTTVLLFSVVTFDSMFMHLICLLAWLKKISLLFSRSGLYYQMFEWEDENIKFITWFWEGGYTRDLHVNLSNNTDINYLLDNGIQLCCNCGTVP